MRRRSRGTPLLMRRVAYLTGRSYRDKLFAPGEVPQLEVRGLDLIVAAGAERGISFDTVFWDDADLPSRDFDLALIRTCWDYHERPEQFVDTLEAHERAGLRVLNAPSVVKWNARKTYLKGLGHTAIPTIWTEKADARAVAQAFDELDATEIVVKPQV